MKHYTLHLVGSSQGGSFYLGVVTGAREFGYDQELPLLSLVHVEVGLYMHPVIS